MKELLFTLAIILITFSNVLGQVPDRAEDVSPLLISEQIPEVDITSLDRNTVSIKDVVKEKRSILVFYRGGWCPYCNKHLSAIGEAKQEILNLGYQIIAISPDSPNELKKAVDKNELSYDLYSDSDGKLIIEMGIAFQAPEKYSSMLLKYSGNKNSGILPVPSLFVIDTDGTILFEYISPNYKNRITESLLLSVLKDLNKE
jgi:peroxiredoxin